MTPPTARTVAARSPLRISLAGGGTDLPEHAEKHGAWLFSAAIDRYVTAYLGRPDALRALGAARDDLTDTFAAHHDLDPESIGVVTDVPPGSGLGGSSTVCVALFRALARYRGIDPLPPLELALQAFAWERRRLGNPVGFQDHVAAALGGVVEMRADPGGQVRAWRHPDLDGAVSDMLGPAGCIVLAPTGGTRAANPLLQELADSFSTEVDPRPPSPAGLLEALQSRDHGAFGHMVARQWSWKTTLAPSACSPRARELIRAVEKAGATGAKVMGAGAAGWLMVVGPPAARDAIHAALRQAGVTIETTTICSDGVRPIEVDEHI